MNSTSTFQPIKSSDIFPVGSVELVELFLDEANDPSIDLIFQNLEVLPITKLRVLISTFSMDSSSFLLRGFLLDTHLVPSYFDNRRGRICEYISDLMIRTRLNQIGAQANWPAGLKMSYLSHAV
jgi:hypothetical protein